MKKQRMVYFVTGILLGAFLFCAVPVLAAGITTVLSTQPVTVDGKPVQVTAYNINGSNYYNLRDMAAILDIGVWYDAAANTVRIESDKDKVPSSDTPVDVPSNGAADPEAAGGAAGTAGVYTITDYYDAVGKFSALGQALPADSADEKTLTVQHGDIVIVGDKQYKVTADSLTLSFYTQPSHEKLLVWWTEYMQDWLGSGKVEEVQ